jgi:hypothetical protein
MFPVVKALVVEGNKREVNIPFKANIHEDWYKMMANLMYIHTGHFRKT